MVDYRSHLRLTRIDRPYYGSPGYRFHYTHPGPRHTLQAVDVCWRSLPAPPEVMMQENWPFIGVWCTLRVKNFYCYVDLGCGFRSPHAVLIAAKELTEGWLERNGEPDGVAEPPNEMIDVNPVDLLERIG